MGKIFLFLVLAAVLSAGFWVWPVQAEDAPAVPAVKTKEPPFKIGSRVSRTLQTVTGLNLLTEVVASEAARLAIQKKVGGKVKVKVKTFSFTDLLAGKVKAVDVQVLDPKVKGFGAGDIKITSDSPFWYQYRRGKGQKTGMQTPVLMSVKAELSEKQIEAALNTPEVTNSLRGLKLDLPGLGDQSLQVLKPKVDLAEERITLTAVLVVQGAAEETGVPVKVSAKPQLEGDRKILLTDLKVDSDGIVEPEKFAAFAETLLNPVIDFARLDRRDHAFRLNHFKIDGEEVVGDGKLLLTPRQ